MGVDLNHSDEGRATPFDMSALGSAHISTSNIVSYTLVSAAAMLAFFFAFQGALLTYYPSIYTALHQKESVWGSFRFPIGNIAITAVCVVPLAFNWWAFRVVSTFNEYLKALIQAGANLEAKCVPDSAGVFAAMWKTFHAPATYGK